MTTGHSVSATHRPFSQIGIWAGHSQRATQREAQIGLGTEHVASHGLQIKEEMKLMSLCLFLIIKSRETLQSPSSAVHSRVELYFLAFVNHLHMRNVGSEDAPGAVVPELSPRALRQLLLIVALHDPLRLLALDRHSTPQPTLFSHEK